MGAIRLASDLPVSAMLLEIGAAFFAVFALADGAILTRQKLKKELFPPSLVATDAPLRFDVTRRAGERGVRISERRRERSHD